MIGKEGQLNDEKKVWVEKGKERKRERETLGQATLPLSACPSRCCVDYWTGKKRPEGKRG